MNQQTIHTYRRYKDLSVIQKINAKANRIAAHKRYNMTNMDWYPIYMMGSDYGLTNSDYSTPFKYQLRPFTN